MRIVIACSKSWFLISDYLKNNHQIIFIKEKHELTVENIKKINPNIIFFPHWNWKVPSEIHHNYRSIYHPSCQKTSHCSIQVSGMQIYH